MLIKIHHSYRDVVAICDNNLLDKKYEDGKKLLDIRKGFFGGSKVDKKELLEMIRKYNKEDATFNIIGENSVNTALKSGIIKKEGIKKVKNIPFALVLL